MKVSWEGIYPAVTTKFNDDESIDFPSFEKGLQFQIDSGVDAFVLAGSLGEASTLSKKEKEDLLTSALDVSSGKVPVILNVAEQRTLDAIQIVRDAEALGAHGFMVLPPMKYNASEEEVVAYFKAIANETGLPIMLYNNPVDYKTFISLDMFDDLLEVENIQAVKESTRDTTNITRMINAFDDRYKILCGVDTLAFESIAAGADGWVAGLVNAFPRETVVIYKLIKAGRHAEAIDIYRWFMPLLELDIYPKLVQYIKLAEVATGTGTEAVRAPRLRLEGDERDLITEMINKGLNLKPNMEPFSNL